MDALDVNGARPAVARVAALPASWTTARERLVLLVLAADSYDGELSAPSYDNVTAWTGMSRAKAAQVLSDLTRPNDRRPSLLAREKSTKGRNRTVWRLLCPNRLHGGDGSPPEIHPQPSSLGGRLNRPSGGDGWDSPPEDFYPQPYATVQAGGTVNRPHGGDTPTNLPYPVVEVGAQAQTARELPGQVTVDEAIADVTSEAWGSLERMLTNVIKFPVREHELADPDANDRIELAGYVSELDMGPCSKCGTKTHKYGPTSTGPLCPDCLSEARGTG